MTDPEENRRVSEGPPPGERPKIFAYGSNMWLPRLQARAASARLVAIGCVTHRLPMFHKRGRDGSAKADAAYTGRPDDRVWGLIVSLNHQDLGRLDECECGYQRESVQVHCAGGTEVADVYVALPKSVQAGLVPFCWYHALVVHGAARAGLPHAYQHRLQQVETATDPDSERLEFHRRLLSQA